MCDDHGRRGGGGVIELCARETAKRRTKKENKKTENTTVVAISLFKKMNLVYRTDSGYTAVSYWICDGIEWKKKKKIRITETTYLQPSGFGK